MVTIKMTEEDYESLLDTIGFSFQALFDECTTEECPRKSDPCYKCVGECVLKHWEVLRN